MIPAVFLNHLFLYVDVETRTAIANSPFMKNEFSAHEVSCVSTDEGENWTGLYIDGEHTYLELFSPSATGAVGDVGVCLGVEQEGDLDRIYRIFQQFNIDRQPDLLTRRIDGKDIPWFRYLELLEFEEVGAAFAPSVLEYDAQYLRNSQADLKPENNGIMRKQYNAARFRPDCYLKDIQSVTLALSEMERTMFGDQLLAFGYAKTPTPEGASYFGPGIHFALQAQKDGVRGITELGLSLLKEKKGDLIYRFAQGAELFFDTPESATWRFYPNGSTRKEDIS